jgi:hypothetical protein
LASLLKKGLIHFAKYIMPQEQPKLFVAGIIEFIIASRRIFVNKERINKVCF